MPTYRAVASTETDPQAPITSALVKALVDNLLAVITGDPTAPEIEDLSLSTGAATTEGIAWVGLRTAGLATGAVGSYAMLQFNSATAASAGSTHAGSGLQYSNAAGSPSGAPSGTWRLMGRTTAATGAPATSLFLRIS